LRTLDEERATLSQNVAEFRRRLAQIDDHRAGLVKRTAARGNVRSANAAAVRLHFAFEIVNVFEFPERALNNRVLVTPTLVAPSCGRRLIGDLSEASQRYYFLQALPR
jgi:hypothetical protein